MRRKERAASIDENKNSHRKITMTRTQTTYINRIALRAGKKGARPAILFFFQLFLVAVTVLTSFLIDGPLLLLALSNSNEKSNSW